MQLEEKLEGIKAQGKGMSKRMWGTGIYGGEERPVPQAAPQIQACPLRLPSKAPTQANDGSRTSTVDMGGTPSSLHSMDG